jgi:hypothetical protein
LINDVEFRSPDSPIYVDVSKIDFRMSAPTWLDCVGPSPFLEKSVMEYIFFYIFFLKLRQS